MNRGLFALEWMAATTAALVVAHLALEIAGAAWLGYALLFILPFFGGFLGGIPVGVGQWLVLRRHVGPSRSWMTFTLLGFVGAWTSGVILAVLVAPTGLVPWKAFLSFAVATPLIGLAQSRVLRRWSDGTRWWLLASTVAWTGFGAVVLFRSNALARTDDLAGRLVSGVAGYAVASNVGATLLGGAIAGGITGIAMAMSLKAEVMKERSSVDQR
jgi:hypothetical protein